MTDDDGFIKGSINHRIATLVRAACSEQGKTLVIEWSEVRGHRSDRWVIDGSGYSIYGACRKMIPGGFRSALEMIEGGEDGLH